MMKALLTVTMVLAMGMAFGQTCEKGESCTMSAQASHCNMKASADDAFMAEAQKMIEASEGHQACCQSGGEKMTMKGGEGCCNEPGKPAKFKIYAMGKYHYFGCEESAKQGRRNLMAKGVKVGRIQTVSGKAKVG